MLDLIDNFNNRAYAVSVNSEEVEAKYSSPSSYTAVLESPLTEPDLTEIGSDQLRRDLVAKLLKDFNEGIIPQNLLHDANEGLVQLWLRQGVPNQLKLWHPNPTWLGEQMIKFMDKYPNIAKLINDFKVKYGDTIDNFIFKFLNINSMAGSFPPAILETVGRQTGRTRMHSVVYFEGIYNCLFLVAAKGGEKGNPGWLYNIRQNPDQVKFTRKEQGVAKNYYGTIYDDLGLDHRMLWNQVVQIVPFFSTYVRYKNQKGDPRVVLPIVKLNPLV